MKPKDISKELLNQRKRFDDEYIKLCIAKTEIDTLEQKIEEGGHYVTMINGRSRVTVPLDKKTFSAKRLGIELINPLDEVKKLLKKEEKEEYGFRRENVRKHIKEKNLEGNTEEIIDGMNQTCKRVIAEGPPKMGLARIRSLLHHDSSALLNFALDYVDKWGMYNELFGQESVYGGK